MNSLREIEFNSGRTPARGFTLIELLVVIAIIAILAALLFPALNRAKASAKSAACKTNLRQLGIELQIYVTESGKYPLGYAMKMDARLTAIPGSSWRDTLLDSCGNNTNLFSCPSELLRFFSDAYRIGYNYNKEGTKNGWGWNASNGQFESFFDFPSNLGLGIFGWPNVAVPESRVLVPSDMIALGEIEGFGWLPTRAAYGYSHGPRANAAFCDGHVESSNPDRIPKVKDLNGVPQFKPDATNAKRFNNDNQPHPETWPKY